jgi:hypothetical protein
MRTCASGVLAMALITEGRTTVRSLVNATMAVLATLWLNLVMLVLVVDGPTNRLTGLSVACGGALLILGIGVRPIAELRRTVRLLVGTGVAWLLIWGAISLLLSTLIQQSAWYYESLVPMAPFCALAAGSNYGLFSCSAKEDDLREALVGLAVGASAAFVTTILMFVATLSGIRGDNAWTAVYVTFVFIPASGVTGAVWSAGLEWRRRSRIPRRIV